MSRPCCLSRPTAKSRAEEEVHSQQGPVGGDVMMVLVYSNLVQLALVV